MPPKPVDRPPPILTQFWNAKGYLTGLQLLRLLTDAAEEEKREVASERKFNQENKLNFGVKPDSVRRHSCNF